MKFVLVDRIGELESGRRIVAYKALSLAEEYLADHFPAFPVLPGVLMLEALVQASAFLAREALSFAPALVLLKEARNVTYKSFVVPGQVLRIESICRRCDTAESEFCASGQVDGREIVRATLTLRHLNLADVDPALADIDQKNRNHWRTLFDRLHAGRLAGTAAAPGA